MYITRITDIFFHCTKSELDVNNCIKIFLVQTQENLFRYKAHLPPTLRVLSVRCCFAPLLCVSDFYLQVRVSWKLGYCWLMQTKPRGGPKSFRVRQLRRGDQLQLKNSPWSRAGEHKAAAPTRGALRKGRMTGEDEQLQAPACSAKLGSWEEVRGSARAEWEMLTVGQAECSEGGRQAGRCEWALSPRAHDACCFRGPQACQRGVSPWARRFRPGPRRTFTVLEPPALPRDARSRRWRRRGGRRERRSVARWRPSKMAEREWRNCVPLWVVIGEFYLHPAPAIPALFVPRATAAQAPWGSSSGRGQGVNVGSSGEAAPGAGLGRNLRCGNSQEWELGEGQSGRSRERPALVVTLRCHFKWSGGRRVWPPRGEWQNVWQLLALLFLRPLATRLAFGSSCAPRKLTGFSDLKALLKTRTVFFPHLSQGIVS